MNEPLHFTIVSALMAFRTSLTKAHRLLIDVSLDQISSNDLLYLTVH
jgi:hypothetical protein